MKKFFMSLAFIALTVISWSQEAPIKATKIIVIDTSNVYESHFRATMKALLKSGYQFESSDINTEMIITQIKEFRFGFLNAGMANIKVTIEYNTLNKPYEVYITGKIIQNYAHYTQELTIENGGDNLSLYSYTWHELEKIAESIPHTSINYNVEDKE